MTFNDAMEQARTIAAKINDTICVRAEAWHHAEGTIREYLVFAVWSEALETHFRGDTFAATLAAYALAVGNHLAKMATKAAHPATGNEMAEIGEPTLEVSDAAAR